MESTPDDGGGQPLRDGAATTEADPRNDPDRHRP